MAPSGKPASFAVKIGSSIRPSKDQEQEAMVSNPFRQSSRSVRKSSRNWVAKRSLTIEPLEDRRLLSVTLNWSGAFSGLNLTEGAAGTTPTVTISEPSSSANLLKIDLGASNFFDAGSTPASTGLSYQFGSPATSHYATIDISETDNITSLMATLPGDALTLGQIRDLNAGIGSITASAATIEVTGIDTSSATAT